MNRKVDSGEIAVLCDDISSAVAEAIKTMIGTAQGDKIVGMGADGTPSRLIDILAEDAALDVMAASGIDMKIITEEKGHITIGEKPEFVVVLDPLDGTYNATHNVPFYSVSIAIGGTYMPEIKYAKVFNLANGNDFTASVDGGAFCNDEEIHVSHTSKLEEFTVAAYGYRDGEDAFKRLTRKVRRIRTLGSAALELCYVASGRFDAFVDVRNRLRVMDGAAGILIVKEAGGIATDGCGHLLSFEFDVSSRINIVASNGKAHANLEKTIGL